MTKVAVAEDLAAKIRASDGPILARESHPRLSGPGGPGRVTGSNPVRSYHGKLRQGARLKRKGLPAEVGGSKILLES